MSVDWDAVKWNATLSEFALRVAIASLVLYWGWRPALITFFGLNLVALWVRVR